MSLLTSKDYLNSYSSSISINFDPLSFEQHLSAVICDLESVDSDNYEEPLYGYEHEDSNIDNEFQHFASAGSKDSAFEDDLSTSSSLEYLIATTSRDICCKSDVILNSSKE